ncbi:MAG: polysaccharide pyruvyl transferase family protein, partial [Thiobacillus sp.]|nr:polysaccharide pyruvyl transferase family protein [Thiobacillus sp.]
MKPDTAPVLFGAFDRHNFGDLLFPHVVAARFPARAFRYAGLRACDMRAFGGHDVERLPAASACLIHAGGELLTCTAWQAAVMLCEPA